MARTELNKDVLGKLTPKQFKKWIEKHKPHLDWKEEYTKIGGKVPDEPKTKEK